MSKKQKTLLYSILTISLISFISKIIGFLREGVVAAYFGTTQESDIFFLAYSAYTVLTVIIGSSIGISYLPWFVNDKERDGYDKAVRFTSKIINQIFILSITITILFFIFAPFLANLIAPKYDQATLVILTEYIRLLSLSLFFSISIYILSSVLNGQKKFGISQSIGLLYRCTTIVMVVIFHNIMGAKSLVYSVIISSILQFTILFFLIFKKKSQYSFEAKFNNEKSRRLYKLIIPVFFGTGTIHLSQLIDKIIASTLSEGSVSALYFSGTLHSFINTLLIASLITVFYTELSKKYAEKDFASVIAIWQNGVSILILILVPLTTFFIANSSSIIQILFERGAFTHKSTELTSSAFTFYVLGSVFYGIRDLTTRFFYVMKNSKTPMINGIISLAANTGLAVILSRTLDIRGITLASVLAALLACSLLIYSLNKRINLNLKILTPTIVKVFFATIVLIITNYILNKIFTNDLVIVNTVISLLINTIIYIGILILLKCKEAILLIKKIKNAIARK